MNTIEWTRRNYITKSKGPDLPLFIEKSRIELTPKMKESNDLNTKRSTRLNKN